MRHRRFQKGNFTLIASENGIVEIEILERIPCVLLPQNSATAITATKVKGISNIEESNYEITKLIQEKIKYLKYLVFMIITIISN